jgi:hypothetical protein
MPRLAREYLGWSEQRWNSAQESISRALERTAKCRHVVPKGPKKLGERAANVAQRGAGPPLAFGQDITVSAVHIFADLQIDDQHIDDEEESNRLIGDAAARMGSLEDLEVIQGGPPAALGAAVAVAPAFPAVARVPRDPTLRRARLNVIAAALAPAVGSTPINAAAAPVGGAPGGKPTGRELVDAIEAGMTDLELAERPGACGLLLNRRLLSVLASQPAPGAPPFSQEVVQIIGGDRIAGTTALSGTLIAGEVAGILFRLEPAALDIVHTMLPTLTFMGRSAGNTDLRVEEEVVVRIRDQAAIHHIVY